MTSLYKFSIFFLLLFFINNDLCANYPTPKNLLQAIIDVNKNCFIKKKSIEKSIAKIPVDEKGYFKPDSDYIEEWLCKYSKKYSFKIPYRCPICFENKSKIFTLQRCCHAFCRLCLVQQYVRKNYIEYTHTKCSICRAPFGAKVRNALKKHSHYKKLYALHEGSRLQKEAELIEHQIEQDRLLAEELYEYSTSQDTSSSED